MKTPAYAKAKKITSRSGADAVAKHRQTLQRAQALLLAQGDIESTYAAGLLSRLTDAYSRELMAYYKSEYNPYRYLQDDAKEALA